MDIFVSFYEISADLGYIEFYVPAYNFACTKMIGSGRCSCLCQHYSVYVCACLRRCTSYDAELVCFVGIRGLGIPGASWSPVAATASAIVAEPA